MGKNIKQFLQLLIDKKRLGTIHSYSAIKKAIFKYSIPFGYLPIRAGTPLFRGRVNDNVGEFFNKITDLCHQTDISKITKFGRANEPQQSIFYCSTTLETALFEVSNIHRFRLENEYEAITYGQWILQKDILVTGLPLVSKNFNKNPLADELDRSFQNIVKKHRNEDTEDWLSVINFFSEEFSKDFDDNEVEYFISCAVANYIYTIPVMNLETKKEISIAGITYPSVQHPSVGMNLAILPRAIQDGTLILDSVLYRKSKRIEKRSYQEVQKIFAKGIDYGKNEILW